MLPKRRLAILLATLFFLASAGITIATLLNSAANADWADTRQTHFSQLRRLFSAIKDVETGQRGYLLTHDQAFLEPYNAGLREARANLAATQREFSSDYPEQIRKLSAAIEGQVQFVGESIELARTGQDAAARARSAEGKAGMDEIRALVKNISDKESALVQQRRRRAREMNTLAIIAVCVSVFVGMLLTGGSILSMLRDLKARETAEEALWAAQAGLEERVRARTQDLAQSNARLQETNRALGEESERRARLQEELWVSNQRFQSAFEHAAVGMGQAGPDGRFHLVNKRLCEITGYPEAELLTKTIQDVTHPDDRAEDGEFARRLWEGEIESYSRRKRYLRKDGQEFWALTTVSLVRDEAGRPKYFIGAAQDIRREIEAERRLVESEVHYRFLADSMPQIVWTAGGDGAVDYYNKRWYDYTGLDVDSNKDAACDAALHPEDREYCKTAWRRAVETGEPYECEYRLERAADRAYRWHLGRALPLRDERGNIVRWFGTATDIDDHKILNESLEQRVAERTADLSESEQRFRSLVEGVRDYAILILDQEGCVSSWTAGAEHITGYTAQDILGKHFSCFYTEEDQHAGQPEKDLETAVKKGEFAAEGWRTCQNGKRFWAHVLMTTLRNPDGSIRGFSNITRDITSRKLSEDLLQKKTHELELANLNLSLLSQRAQQASEAKSNFLAAMSHEIRTPMNAILGMADLLWESNLDLEQRRYVEVFRRAGQNLLTLINDILDLSKIESGSFELERIDFDLADVVERTTELVMPKARAKGLELVCRFSPSLQTSLNGDPVRLQQILLNLLGNAVKFTDYGEVVLTAEPDPDIPGGVFFSVSDTGIGIPAEKLEHIFGDFTQADASTTRKFGGTGLGLGISKRLVAMMGGTLTVKSSLNSGSVFSFVARFGIARNVAKKNETRALEDFHGQRVLIIDDNATNLLIVRETLSSWGLKTREHQSAQEGIVELSKAAEKGTPYALVLLDSRMPSTSGFEALASIRSVSPDIPIIMLTSDNSPGDITRGKQYNLTGYAVKPVQRSELLRMICSALPTVRERNASSLAAAEQAEKAPALPMRILVAEDSPDNRVLLEAYLKGGPYRITFAENGKLAVDLFSKERYDLVLMDMQMPVMDGLTATREMRSLEWENQWKVTPIIALTANALPRDIEAALEAGCNSHLSKPISKQKLIQAIEERRPAPGETREEAVADFEVPLGMEEYARKYIENRKREMPVLQALRSSFDFKQLRTLAHNMKGTGTSYGFPELTRLGDAMEASAEKQDGGAIDQQLLEVARYLEKASEFLGANDKLLA